MQRLTAYTAAALAIAALTWWLVAMPRIELAQAHLEHAHLQLAAAGLLDMERVAVIEAQAEQLTGALVAELKNRELLQSLAIQSREQSRTLEELKRNDETIAEYLRSPVPADLGRLYQRAATTDPGDYRKPPEVRTDPMPASSTASVNDK